MAPPRHGARRPAVHVRPAREADLPAMADVYNQGIRDRIATFETQERTPEDLRPWLRDPAHPVLVATGPDADPDADQDQDAAAGSGDVMGWIAASPYRPRACYAGVAEFSVYVARAARGRGIGHLLVEAFLPACAGAGLWKVLSRVFPENHASRRLLAAHGFREVGTYLRHAKLDGAWRDVVIVERLLGAAESGAAEGDDAQDWSASPASSSSSPS